MNPFKTILTKLFKEKSPCVKLDQEEENSGNQEDTVDDIFAEMAQKENTLFEQLASAAIVDITGVVGANGASGGITGKQKLWSLTLFFDAWRIGENPMRNEELVVRRKVTHNELKKFQEAIDAETIISIKARFLEENIFETPQALLEKLIGVNGLDIELKEKLSELQKPKTHSDDFFGEFTFDRQVDWYSAKTDWGENAVTLNLSLGDNEEFDSALKIAHSLWNQQILWNERVQDQAVQELLGLKNENWLEDNDKEVTQDEFLSQMQLETVVVYPNGDFEFWHNDGDLFWGRSIQVNGSLSKGVTSAGISG